MKRIKLILIGLVMFLVTNTCSAKAADYPHTGVLLGFDQISYVSGFTASNGRNRLDVGRFGATVRDDCSSFPGVSVDTNTNRYIIMKINNQRYVLRHAPIFWARFPYDLRIGQSYKIRFARFGNGIQILRPDGKEVRTQIVAIN